MTSVSSPSLDLDAFKDPALALGLVESINKLAPAEGMTLMEVCGTHTVSIARNGIRDLMPQNTRLAQASQNHVVVVLDEYGQTSGLVTMEDILEELVYFINSGVPDSKHHLRYSKVLLFPILFLISVLENTVRSFP